MPRYRAPVCKAPDPAGRGTCDVRMHPLGERHPSFGPNFQPGHWVFICPRCSSVRAISDEQTERYVERIR